MNEEQKKKTLEENSAYICAFNEGKIKKADLISEIKPLLEEYFICDIQSRDESLILNFLNGQSFTLTVK